MGTFPQVVLLKLGRAQQFSEAFWGGGVEAVYVFHMLKAGPAFRLPSYMPTCRGCYEEPIIQHQVVGGFDLDTF